jgi:hypothetical protein
MRWWLVALALALSAPAFAQDGTAMLSSGKGTIKVKPGCGKDSQPLFGTWVFSAGTWTATSGAGLDLSGTSAARGMSGKVFDLQFDAQSKDEFDDALESWASAVCGVPVTLQAQGSTVSSFSLKLNKRQTRAKLTLFATGNGTSAAGKGVGTYKAIVRGSWQPAP